MLEAAEISEQFGLVLASKTGAAQPITTGLLRIQAGPT